MGDAGQHAFMESMKKLSAYEFITDILVIAFIVGAIVFACIKIYQAMEKYRRIVNEFEKAHEMLLQHEQYIKDLKAADTKFQKQMDGFDTKLDGLTDSLKTMQDRSDTKNRASLKNEISKMYRRFNKTKKWTEMDKNTLEDLIASYEDCGGKNSFVHSVVQKEMYSWEIVDEDEMDDIEA